jgi:hypothetical protein
LVNENSSILSLLFLFSHIFSANYVCHLLARYFYAGSTHLHGIRANRFLGKRHTRFFLQVPNIEDNGKMEFPKEFILTPYNLFAWKEKMIVHIRGRGLYRLTMDTETEPTSTIEKSQVSELNG